MSDVSLNPSYDQNSYLYYQPGVSPFTSLSVALGGRRDTNMLGSASISSVTSESMGSELFVMETKPVDHSNLVDYRYKRETINQDAVTLDIEYHRPEKPIITDQWKEEKAELIHRQSKLESEVASLRSIVAELSKSSQSPATALPSGNESTRLTPEMRKHLQHLLLSLQSNTTTKSEAQNKSPRHPQSRKSPSRRHSRSPNQSNRRSPLPYQPAFHPYDFLPAGAALAPGIGIGIKGQPNSRSFHMSPVHKSLILNEGDASTVIKSQSTSKLSNSINKLRNAMDSSRSQDDLRSNSIKRRNRSTSNERHRSSSLPRKASVRQNSPKSTKLSTTLGELPSNIKHESSSSTVPSSLDISNMTWTCPYNNQHRLPIEEVKKHLENCPFHPLRKSYTYSSRDGKPSESTESKRLASLLNAYLKEKYSQ